MTGLRAVRLPLLLGGSLLLLTACEQPTKPVGGLSPQARAYLDSALSIMEERSVRRLTIDWPSFRAAAIQYAGDAQTPAATYPAIGFALTQIGDGHSMLLSPGGGVLHAPTHSCVAPAPASAAALGPFTAPDDVGYVWVGSFSGSPSHATAFADSLVSAIRIRDESAEVAGWIVDLRGNLGGNMWPMIAGLGPIVGEGVLGHFVYPDGTAISWGYQHGASVIGSSVAQSVSAPYRLRSEQPRVAVLLNHRVASSGEATAIAFKRRPDTRFFGTPTCGLSTSNVAFTLSDGALLILAVAVMADRELTTYGAQVMPDEFLGDPEQLLERATAWVRAGGE